MQKRELVLFALLRISIRLSSRYQIGFLLIWSAKHSALWKGHWGMTNLGFHHLQSLLQHWMLAPRRDELSEVCRCIRLLVMLHEVSTLFWGWRRLQNLLWESYLRDYPIRL